MAFNQLLTATRTLDPEPTILLANLRVLDATIGFRHELGTRDYLVQKATPWTPADIAAVLTVIEAAPVGSPQALAQAEIDRWPIAMRAFALTLIDQLNVIRAALPTPLSPITPAQALAAIRAKAGTL